LKAALFLGCVLQRVTTFLLFGVELLVAYVFCFLEEELLVGKAAVLFRSLKTLFSNRI